MALPVLALLLGLGLTSCTADTAPTAPPSEPPRTTAGTTTTLEPEPVAARVRVTRVAGWMRPRDREVLARRVGAVVMSYLDDAYLAGEQPRTSFDGAFPTFTRGAARSARRHLELTTNAALGSQASAVVPRRRTAYLAVLSPTGVATGVTAQVHLEYLVERGDAPSRSVTVRGRLMLTRVDGEWRIFGYDLTRGESAGKVS